MGDISEQHHSVRWDHPFALVTVIILGVIYSLFAVTESAGETMLVASVGFAPTFVADARFHQDRAAIFALNLCLFGFLVTAASLGTIIFGLALMFVPVGWIVALVWSFTVNRTMP